MYAIQSLDISPSDAIDHGGELLVHGEVYSPDHRQPVVLIGIVRADGTPVYGVASDMDGAALTRIDAHRYRYSLELPGLQLLPGKYFVRGLMAGSVKG